MQPGTRLGPYEIMTTLGAGGMGAVYRAHDAHLNRDVALKVLLDAVVGDAEHIARFTREAHVLASLNHPHIAHLYGFEAGPPTSFLVMELVEGPTLAELIKTSPSGLPLEQVLLIARQIAEALEAAHEHGVIHRDLKPANIKVRDDDVVKVLDFGLARTLDPGPGTLDAANSPTLTVRATQMGMILGTAAYMAPEQAKGRAVDKRADVWAFGVVLYEMLTGRRLFEGEDISETLAAVLRQDISLAALPASTPPRLTRLVGRCLERDPKQRLRDIGEARVELTRLESGAVDVLAPPVIGASGPTRAATIRQRVIAAAAMMLIVGLAITATWTLARLRATTTITRMSMLAPPGANIFPDSAQVAFSPDGTMVAFVVGSEGGATALWVRSLSSLTARPLDGTAGANLPFWSPDSTRIGFFAAFELKTSAVKGGRAETVCRMPGDTVGRGGSWNASDVIVFGTGTNDPLYRVSANRGEPVPVTTIDGSRKQSGHRFPVFLPDGDHFLYAALPARDGKFDIFAASLSDGASTLVGAMENGPVYVDPGWLLYARQGVLAARPFDARTLHVTGEPVSLADEPTSLLDAVGSFTAGPSTSVSASGALAYYSAASMNTTATWLGPTGQIAGTVTLPVGQYSELRIAPNGTHAALVRSISVTEASLWLVEFAHPGPVPLSTGRGRNESPVWSPDSRTVVFASDREGDQHFFVKKVDASSPEQPLYRSAAMFKHPDAWSRDGEIVFTELGANMAYDLWRLPVSSAGVSAPPVPYLVGPGSDLDGLPSPDGPWLAYTSKVAGSDELYVQSYPQAGQKQRISTGGVVAKWWSKDSRHLLYVSLDRTLWRSDVEPLKMSDPVRIGAFPPDIVAVDMLRDGSRFLALIPERSGAGSVTIVQNWRAALEKKR